MIHGSHALVLQGSSVHEAAVVTLKLQLGSVDGSVRALQGCIIIAVARIQSHNIYEPGAMTTDRDLHRQTRFMGPATSPYGITLGLGPCGLGLLLQLCDRGASFMSIVGVAL